MRRFRRHLAPVFGTWLLCHAVGLALVPVATCVVLADSRAEPECTCNHAGATQCPMHHHRPTGPSKTNCTCDGAPDDSVALLAPIFAPPAVVTPLSVIDAPKRAVPSAAALSTPPAFVPADPDPRPPRA